MRSRVHELRRGRLFEIALIVLVCFAYAGAAPPGTNEPHYLGKARHYWDPSWCRGDFFLDSADAHLVFYWTFGWTTRWLPLPVAAWLGRLIAWGLFAVGWQRLVRSLLPLPGAALGTAAVYLALVQYGHLSGEWIVGGVEAKSFAYGFVLLGLTELVRNRWRWVWPTLGVAASFHVLVGGWSVIAAGVAWCLTPRNRRPSPRRMLGPLLAGGLLALPGLLPALRLSWQVPETVLREANFIYVFERLGHHLVVHRFPPAHLARFGAIALAWLISSQLLRRPRRLERLHAFVWGSMLIAVAGIAIDQMLLHNLVASASLLRYYWFRLSDTMVPLGLTLSLAVGMQRWRSPWRPALAAGVASVTMLALAHAVMHEGPAATPGAHQQERFARPDGQDGLAAVRPCWKAACAWVDANLPPGAIVLTPLRQQTFKWYAGRAEFVTWKDVPQDPAGILRWRDRMQVATRIAERARTDPSALEQLVRDHGVTYVVWLKEGPVTVPLQVIYENARFVVCRIEGRGAPS
jgi:hypothetical protein